MGNRLHVRYLYCENIAHFSVILWGYVLIWYSCGDGGIDGKRWAMNGVFLRYRVNRLLAKNRNAGSF